MTKRDLVRIGYTEACFSLLWAKQRSRTTQAAVCHDPAIVQWETQWQLLLGDVDLSLALPRRADPDSELSWLTLCITGVVPLSDH